MSNSQVHRVPIRLWCEDIFPVVPTVVLRRPGTELCARPTWRPRIFRPLRFPGLVMMLTWLGMLAALAVDVPLVWRWANPQPHGANVVDQAANDFLTVQVGERGQIYLSDDWNVWSPRDSGTAAALRGTTFFNGRLVVTGEAGTVMLADDPWNFYGFTLGTADWLESVAASSTVVVAVGDHAAIYTSTNAISWERVPVAFTNWLRSVACDGTNFVAVGEKGLLATSANGTSWQVRAAGLTATNLNRVTWLGDHFLAVGDGGKAFTSANGNQWSAVNLGATNYLYAAGGSANSHLAAGVSEARLFENGEAWSDQTTSAWTTNLVPAWTYYSALWNQDYYLLAGRSGMLVESCRTNLAASAEWRSLADPVRSWLWGITRTPTHFVAVGDYGTILSSPDGVDWDYELVPLSATNSILLGVGGNSNLLLAVGSQGTILWGTNTYFWQTNVLRPTTNDLQGVCYDGEQFIVTGGNGTVLTSASGTNWTRQVAPTSAFLMSVAAYPDGLVAVGSGGTILTSVDHGTNWTSRVSGTTNWLSQVRWLNDRLIAVGQNGCLLSSFDGVHWLSKVTGTTAWLNAYDYAAGTWFVVGNLGTVLASTDATNWTSSGTLTKKSLYGVISQDGLLVTVGTEGTILRTRLIPDPAPIAIAGYGRSSGMNVFLFTGATDQQFRLQASADLTTWTDGALLEFLDGSGTLIYVEDTGGREDQTRFYRALRVR